MSSHSRRFTVSAAFALVSALAANAAAQASGFAIDRFNPSERGSDWFAADSLDLRGHFRAGGGIVAEYVDRPLVLVDANGSTNAVPVKDQLILHFGSSFVFADRVRVGFDLPVAVFADGTAGTVKTTPYAATSDAGLGDLRLGADARLVGRYGDAFTMAAGLAVFLPMGSQGAYMSDGDVRLLPRVAVAGDIGMFAYAAHVGFQVRPLDNAFPGYPTGSEVEAGASVGLRLLERRLLVGPEVYGSTVVTNSGALFSTRQTPVEGLIGVHYAVDSYWKVGVGVAMGLTRGFGEPLARAVISVEARAPWVPPPSDRDGDGVIDRDDACPDLPGIPSHDPKANGCPLTDRDHDGVPDYLDACPDTPGVKTDDPKTNGCPSDRDHDGVPDTEDACVDVPGVKMDEKTTNGCPPDSDHDGVLDVDDACPGIPGVRTTDPKTNGCPDPDHDKDGIPNEVDACPDVAGPPNADPTRNGCPEAYVQDDLLKTRAHVEFAAGSAVIPTDKESLAALGAVVEMLAAHPEIKHLRVESHTDNQGDAGANKALSDKRAASVVAWLMAHGVAQARLTSMGVGSDSPLQDNTTEEGRRANRRIELHIEP